MRRYNFLNSEIHLIILALIIAFFVQSETAYCQVVIKPVDGSVQFVAGKSAHIVANPATPLEKRITDRLAEYLFKVLKQKTKVLKTLADVPSGSPAIVLSSKSSASISSSSAEAFTIETKIAGKHQLVLATGKTEQGLKRAVQRLVLKSEQRAPGLVIPELHLSETPWIPEREWTIPTWAPDRVRRSFSNPAVDKRLNIWLYGDQQIKDYVEMFDWFGFNGCQLTESSANYAAMGSVEAFQDRQIKFAKAIRENGQQVTYWVWAAQFDDYGWFDPEVTYTPAKGNTAFNDPKVRAEFEKYYNGYAKMAPYIDLLIAHFYDPGSLTNREDVFSYLGLLQNKFKSKNPKIKLGVDFWAAGSPAEYMKQLTDHGFGNALLLEMSLPNVYKEGQREALHDAAKQRNLKLGMWGWYMTEYETDQRPMMHVNAMALKDFYQQIKNGVHRIQPFIYWSEMEAYHLNNIFTMYAAAQLLWNPDRDTDEILREIAEGIWGPRNGPAVLEALQLIQDVRSGPTWNTFWWTTKEYRLGTDDPKKDLDRAEKVIARFEKMEMDSTYVPKFPLPFPPSTFIELTLPHLRQIKAFAAFRVKEMEIRKLAGKGISNEDLTRLVTEAWTPIPDYNTWIGSFGQPEETMQEKMISKLSKDFHIDIKMPGWLRYRNANRYLQRIQNIQRKLHIPFRFNAEGSSVKDPEFIWPQDQIKDYTEILLNEGLLQKVADNSYQLINWEEYRMH